MFWMNNGMQREGEVWEVVAVDRHWAHLLEWRSEGPVIPGTVLRLGPGEDSQAIGAGVRSGGEWSLACPLREWTMEEGYLVETTGDTHHEDGSNTCRVHALRERWIQAAWPREDVPALANPEWVDAEIFTEWKTLHRLFYENSITCCGDVPTEEHHLWWIMVFPC